MKIDERLEKYCLIPALSGFEEPMMQALLKDLKEFSDELRTDTLGNVIATIKSKKPTKNSLMIFAHMDQIGMVVKSINAAGFLTVERVGGVPERILAGKAVVIQTENKEIVNGVIGTFPHHFTPDDKKYVVQPVGNIYIDIGAKNQSEVLKMGVNIGAPVMYEPAFRKLANKRVAATSMDDRGGCAVIVEVAKALFKSRPNVDVYIVGSVQEEFNLRGAMVAAQQLLPTAAISIDLAVACDTPDMNGKNSLTLGAGPVMGMYSFHGRGTLNGLIPHPKMVSLVVSAANSLGISLQRHASVGALTDASYVQLVGNGVACIDLAWPTRYTHTGIETSQISDLEELAKLVTNVAQIFPVNFEPARGK